MKLPQRWTAQPASLGLTQGYRHFQLLGSRAKGLSVPPGWRRCSSAAAAC